MKHNGHCTFESVTDSWGAHSDTLVPSFLLMRYMCWFTSHNNVTEKVNKQVKESFRDHRRKKVGKQGKLPTPADILVVIQSIPMTELEIKCSLVYLQV